MKAQTASWSRRRCRRRYDPEQDDLADGMDGYNRAYDGVVDAAEQMVERSTDAAQGEDVDPAEFRDIWLRPQTRRSSTSWDLGLRGRQRPARRVDDGDATGSGRPEPVRSIIFALYVVSRFPSPVAS